MDIPLPNDIFDVRTSPKKRPDGQTSGSTVKAVNSEPVRRSPRKKASKMNYVEDERNEEVVPVGTAVIRAVVSPTKAVIKKRRSLKPVEGGLAFRLETASEVVHSVDEGGNDERLDDPKQQTVREGEQASIFRLCFGTSRTDPFLLQRLLHLNRRRYMSRL
jgi:hypothetical protein